MTIFGTDISNYQAGLNLARLTQSSFIIAKCSEGTYYSDAAYPGWRAQAAALAKPFAWYHFLSGEDPHAQAQHNLSCVGDKTLPGMLDVEIEGSFHPSLAQVLAYIDAAHAAGLNLRLCYLPRWYWEQIGSPDLSGLAQRGVHLVSSSYPSSSSGSVTGLYPGDNAAGWQPYGGLTPLLYQFTSQAADGGQYLDYNAFKGTVAELTAALAGTTPTPTGEPDMQLSDQVHFPPAATADYPDYGFYGPVTVQDLLAWTAARVSHIANHLPPPVDVGALEAFIAQHQAAGTSATDLAAALVAHLGIQVVAK